MDRLTAEHRSWNMSRIRSKDTAPERAVRSSLHRAGLRFRLHDRTLPGTPDIVLRKHKIVVLVHGCFWHRHPRCRYAYAPKSRPEFWEAKFAANIARDARIRAALRRLGWTVVVVWECQASVSAKLMSVIARIRRLITMRGSTSLGNRPVQSTRRLKPPRRRAGF